MGGAARRGGARPANARAGRRGAAAARAVRPRGSDATRAAPDVSPADALASPGRECSAVCCAAPVLVLCQWLC